MQAVGQGRTYRLQAQGDLAVMAHFLDEALLVHARTQELEHLVLVDQAPVAVVDDGLEAHRRFAGHQQLDRLPDFVVGRGDVQVTVQA
ncbi:hypothetical protein D3C79_813280 [compost metagenome]